MIEIDDVELSSEDEQEESVVSSKDVDSSEEEVKE